MGEWGRAHICYSSGIKPLDIHLHQNGQGELDAQGNRTPTTTSNKKKGQGDQPSAHTSTSNVLAESKRLGDPNTYHYIHHKRPRGIKIRAPSSTSNFRGSNRVKLQDLEGTGAPKLNRERENHYTIHTNRTHNHWSGNVEDGGEGELGLAMEEEEIARTRILSVPPNEMGRY